MKHRIFHGTGSQNRQIKGSGIVLIIIQTMRIGIMGLRKPKLLCPLVHCFRKGLYAAGMKQGQSRCCIISGVKHHTVEQCFHAEHLSRLQIQR